MSERPIKRAADAARRAGPQSELHHLMREFFARGLSKDDLIVILANQALLVIHDDLSHFTEGNALPIRCKARWHAGILKGSEDIPDGACCMLDEHDESTPHKFK